MKASEDLFKELDHLTYHLANIQRILILQGRSPAEGTRGTPMDRSRLVAEISAKWTGPGAVDEIRGQREKST